MVTIHELTLMIIFIGFFVFNIMFLFEQNNVNGIMIQYIMPFKSLSYSIGILYLGLFASVVASFSSTYALKHLTAPQFSVFSNLSTLISIIAGAVILKEPLSMTHYVGIFLILIGVIGTNFSHLIETHLSLALKKS